jgi:hypothetical protein
LVPQELVINIGLLIMIKLLEHQQKDTLLKETQLSNYQDVLPFSAPTDKLVLRLFVMITYKFANKKNKFQIMMMK